MFSYTDTFITSCKCNLSLPRNQIKSETEFEPEPEPKSKTAPPAEKQKKAGSKRQADLQGGMELLENEFLIELVSDIDHSEDSDVEMHKLCFMELVHRGRLKNMDSSIIKAYAKNERHLYGKDVQCLAMKELASRSKKSRHP